MYNYDIYGDVETFMHDVGCERIWRFWVYRRIYTPYEQQSQFIDESQFEDSHCNFGIIREVINLQGDYLIGFEMVYEENDFQTVENAGLEYYRLSEIRLAYYRQDMAVEYDCEDEDG